MGWGMKGTLQLSSRSNLLPGSSSKRKGEHGRLPASSILNPQLARQAQNPSATPSLRSSSRKQAPPRRLISSATPTTQGHLPTPAITKNGAKCEPLDGDAPSHHDCNLALDWVGEDIFITLTFLICRLQSTSPLRAGLLVGHSSIHPPMKPATAPLSTRWKRGRHTF